jgi:hypothetical protein
MKELMDGDRYLVVPVFTRDDGITCMMDTVLGALITPKFIEKENFRWI